MSIQLARLASRPSGGRVYMDLGHIMFEDSLSYTMTIWMEDLTTNP